MIRVKLDDVLRERLHGLKEEVALCDEAGRVVARPKIVSTPPPLVHLLFGFLTGAGLFTVRWTATALTQLADIWNSADSAGRVAITRATNAIDRRLTADAPNEGASRSPGLRVLFELPLGIRVTVEASSRTALVIAVWRFLSRGPRPGGVLHLDAMLPGRPLRAARPPGKRRGADVGNRFPARRARRCSTSSTAF
jgi:hypothetical protein